MTILDSILKSRDITLLTKVHSVKTMLFPVVMYGCENWTIKMPKQRNAQVANKWKPLNCSLKKTPAQQGDQTSQFLRKSNLNIHWKD